MTPSFEINVKSPAQESPKSLVRPSDVAKIESINRVNRRFNLLCQIITYIIIFSIVASMLAMVALGLKSLAAEIATWQIGDLQRAIVGY